MALASTISTQEDFDKLDPAIQSEYKIQEDKSYKLDVPDMVSKAQYKEKVDKVDEFRQSNIDLKNQVDEKDGKMKGIDLERFNSFLETERKVKEKELLEKGDIDAIVDSRIGEMKDNHTTQIKDKDTELSSAKSQLHKLLVTNALQAAASESGAHPTAVADIVNRGEQVFTLKDGKVVAMDGENPILNKNGEPKSISEYMDGLTGDAPHLFQQSTGADTKDTSSVSPKKVIHISQSEAINNLEGIRKGTHVVKR